MLVNSIPGRQQKTFRLVSEETSLRPRAKVAANPPAVANSVSNAWNAGHILTLSSGNLVKLTSSGSANGLYGVAFESHNSTLDECAMSQLGTWIVNRHIGQTTMFDATVSSSLTTAGDELGISDSATNATDEGGFAETSGSGVAVGYALRMLGDWLEYLWFGQPVATS